MQITAIVIDDEEKGRKALSSMLNRYCPGLQLLAEAADADRAYELINEMAPDVIFLDIEMPKASGFDLLKRFSQPAFSVIFVTAYDRYAMQAIKLCALDYLLKPVNAAELQAAVRKVEQQREQKQMQTSGIRHLLGNMLNKNMQTNKIALPTQHGLEFIPIDRIIRCEADGSYTAVILSDGSRMLSTRGLKEYESLLPTALFLRVHHSHIINLEHIRKYFKGEGGYVIMSDKSSVDIAKRKKKEFLDRVNFHG